MRGSFVDITVSDASHRLSLWLGAAPNHGLGRHGTLWVHGGRSALGVSMDLHVRLTFFLMPQYAAEIARMITAFVDFNGVVPEKFDPVAMSHLVDAEYVGCSS